MHVELVRRRSRTRGNRRLRRWGAWTRSNAARQRGKNRSGTKMPATEGAYSVGGVCLRLSGYGSGLDTHRISHGKMVHSSNGLSFVTSKRRLGNVRAPSHLGRALATR
eukprot:5179315-Pleurochrysis_carterae.AAC.1